MLKLGKHIYRPYSANEIFDLLHEVLSLAALKVLSRRCWNIGVGYLLGIKIALVTKLELTLQFWSVYGQHQNDHAWLEVKNM